MLMLSRLSRLRFAGLAARLRAVSAELLLRHGTGIAISAEIATDDGAQGWPKKYLFIQRR